MNVFLLQTIELTRGSDPIIVFPYGDVENGLSHVDSGVYIDISDSQYGKWII